MACWYRVQRVSVHDVFACEVRCDEGAHCWSLTDTSGPVAHVLGSGDGPVPTNHLPLGTSMDALPWHERVPHWLHDKPRVRATWPEVA